MAAVAAAAAAAADAAAAASVDSRRVCALREGQREAHQSFAQDWHVQQDHSSMRQRVVCYCWTLLGQ